MENEYLWLCLLAGFNFLLALLIAFFEYDPKFEAQFLRLRPGDLKNSPYCRALRSLLSRRSVLLNKICYVLFSLIVVNFAAGSIACWEPLRDILDELIPPIIFRLLEAPINNGCRSSAVFLLAIILAVGLHLFPVVLGIFSTQKDRERADRTTGEAIMESLQWLFLFQQQVLEHFIGYLLRYPRRSIQASDPNEPTRGLITKMAKTRLAIFIEAEIDRKVIDAIYENNFKYKPGASAAKALNADYDDTISVKMKIIRLIDKLGVPALREELKWEVTDDAAKE